MDEFERVELRRFVGRELLLFLWFESEIFEATLSTREHGSFGLWLEGRLVLSAGHEVTSIKGSSPGSHREAKEALRRGKLPELAALHLSWGERDATFQLKAESLAIAGLKLPRPRDEAAPESGEGKPRVTTARRPRRAAPGDAAAAAKNRSVAEEADAVLAHEDFFERMRVTREIETVVEALYRDFLALRLGPAWDSTVAPALAAWVAGAPVDADGYAKSRARAVRAS